MEAVLEALAEQQAELRALLDPLDDAGWEAPSACEGWSVADVVLHLAQTNELAIGSARDDLPAVMARLADGIRPVAGNVDDGADAMVAHERGAAPAALLERYDRSCVDLRAALLERSPADRLQWMVGDLAARTLGTTRLAETWIHTGDVAAGVGVTLEPADRLWHVARLAWRTLPYAFARDGREGPAPVAFELTAPSGAAWSFQPDEPAQTTVTGPGADLCLVASRRVRPEDTALTATGPDAAAVLELVRTWA